MSERSRQYTILYCFCALLLLLFAQPILAQDPALLCDLYPIALHRSTLEAAEVGDVLEDILSGSQPGNFGWLTWTGDPDSTADRWLSLPEVAVARLVRLPS